MNNKHINPRAIEIFHAICQYGKFNANGKLQISQTELGLIIGEKSRWTVSRAIKTLCKAGVVEKYGNWICKDGQNQREANTYIPTVPREIASKASSKNKKLQTVIAGKAEQTSKEKFLQTLRDAILLSERIDANEDMLSLKKEMLNFIEAQEKLDAKREATYSKEVITIVTEKTSLRASETKSVPVAQTSIAKGVSLCSKKFIGINIKSNINTKITTAEILKIREGPLKPVVDFKNFEKNSKVAEETCLQAEKAKLEQQKSTLCSLMMTAKNNDERSGFLAEYCELDNRSLELDRELDKKKKAKAQLVELNLIALAKEKITEYPLLMANLIDRKIDHTELGAVYKEFRDELVKLRETPKGIGELYWDLIFASANALKFDKSGNENSLRKCKNIMMKIYKKGGRDKNNGWSQSSGSDEHIAKNAKAILQMQIPN
ncbi:hypothetical protein GAMM_130020 [Gammaproteobacteria bacterium]